MNTDHVELKALATRREQAERRMKALEEESKALNEKLRAEHREISQIDAQVAKLKKKNRVVVVSEHAILRFLERVEGVDIEAVKRRILPEAVQKVAQELGAGEFPAGTHSVKVKDNVVVTVMTKEKQEVKHPPRHRKERTPIPPGMVECPRCKSAVDRLLPNHLCDDCTTEKYAGDE